jgi:cytidylate kinase
MVDVIAIDGPSASGKGTVAQRVAEQLGYYYLDSGAIYRAAAYAALQAGADLADATAVARIAGAMNLAFRGGHIWLDHIDVSDQLRNEACGREASKIAALQAVRAALLQRQRDFRQMPGLVADGRDMGSVVFPDAPLKVFLTAGVEERARRRANQLAAQPRLAQAAENDPKGLIEKENSGNIDALFANVLADLRARDERDSQRAAAPLVRLAEAKLLDTSSMSVEQAVTQVLDWYRELAPRS